MGGALLLKRYNTQRTNAIKRGIGWSMTFEDWMSVWSASGNLKQRGRATGQYCMCRIGDVGPYKIGNVEILTVEKNLSDSHANGRHEFRGMTDAEIEAEKSAFLERNGITVLDWLKDAIDWHFKVAPLKLIAGPVVWPRQVEVA